MVNAIFIDLEVYYASWVIKFSINYNFSKNNTIAI